MCSTGCSPKNNFSSLNGTWSKRSDLLMNDYNPYPELEGTNCYARENFCASGSSSTCSSGNIGSKFSPYGPCAQYPSQTYAYSQTNPGTTAARYQVKFSENFCCNSSPQGYNVLDKTWSQQRTYNL